MGHEASAEPLVALPKASHVCSSGAFGPFYHAGDPLFSKVDADLDRITYEVSFEPYAHPERPQNVGGMHGHGSHSWSGNPSKSHTLIAGHLTDYGFTGNLHYAAFAKWFLDEVMSEFMEQKDSEGAIAPADDRANAYIPRLMWLIIEAKNRDPGAFETACIEWRAKRDTTPERPPMELPDMLGPDGSAYRSLGLMVPEQSDAGPRSDDDDVQLV